MKELQDQLGIVDQTIRSLESKVKKVNCTPSVNMLLIKKIIRYDSEIQNLQNANSLYDKKIKSIRIKKRVNKGGIKQLKKIRYNPKRYK